MLYCFLHRFLWLLRAFPSLYAVFLILSQLFFHFAFSTVSCGCFLLFRGFSMCFVQHFFSTCFLPFSPLSSMGFCTICASFLRFHAFSTYFSKSFTRPVHFPIVFAPFPLVVITCSCTFTVFFQHFYCIVMVCS